MEILGYLVVEIILTGILSGIGWVCLYVWYRDRKKIEKIKNEKYAGNYSSVGGVMILNLIAGVGAITLSVGLIFALAAWIYNLVTN